MRTGLESAARARLDPDVADAFLARVKDRLDDTIELIERVYGDAGLVDTLLEVVLDALAERPATLRALDRERERDPGWFLRPDMVGYVCYVDRFAGTLAGVGDRLDYLDELGVRYLHLMPLLASRPGENDGGYAVSDYDAVESRLGTMAELSALADQLHERGVALCVDVAINHTAREHVWAQRARDGELKYRNYYLVYSDRTLPDEFEKTTLDIFPELAPGTFTFVPEMDAWVWTSFREFQWDLNYANPDVFRAMLETLLRLANRGPDVLRIDAAPFLRKRLGTTCLDLPETHLILQAFRALTWMAAPGVLLKAEAMLDPDAVLRYLGGETPECDLAYDNQVMVLLWSSLALGDTRLATQALTRRLPPPARATWVTYVRCHDDIGWAIDDVDAASAGYDGRELRARISDFYAAPYRGVRFQANAQGAHPISGMAASLTRIDGPDDPLAARRIETLYSVAFSIGGIPLIYMGDELALPNDDAWADDPAHHGDNRWLHRPAMDWSVALRPSGTAAATLDRIRTLARIRRATPALHANAALRVIAGDPRVLAYTRGEPGEFLAVANVSTESVDGTELLRHAGIDVPEIVHASEPDVSAIPPAGFVWWRQARPQRA